MSARMMKKVLKEQEAALQQQQQQQPVSEDDSESSVSPPPARNYFDLLEDEDDNSISEHNHEHLDQPEKEETAFGTSDRAISSKPSTMEKGSNRAQVPNAKSKKNKKKKKKNGEDRSHIPSDFTLETLSLEASSSGYPPNSANKLKKSSTDNDKVLKKQNNSSVLQVDPKFLSAENELRRIFGNSVVKTHERSNVSANSRQVRGGRHILKRTILVSPSQHWPRWDGSLSMELLETKDGVHYFKYVQSSSYAQAQRVFEAARASHDLNAIGSILLNHPYHTESLLTLADYFKFIGEHQMSADSIGKCLYALECAWHPLFTPSKNCQLKYSHETNKPLFTSLITHMKNMDRRGCHRSALEICKLLLSLDSDDPVGAMLCIDYYSLRAEEYAWLELFADEYNSDNSLWLFPNFSFSLAACRFYLERDEKQSDSDPNKKGVMGKANSYELMKQALMLHPSVLKKLAVKVPLKDRKWTALIEHKFFRSEKTGSPSLSHLIAIYVERSYLLWRLPDMQKLLYDSAVSVMEMVEKQAECVKDWACVRKEAFSSEKNEYSHLLVSDFSDSVPTMPPDNLQDFIVHPRGGVEQREQVQDNHLVRDVSNRNVLAVLLESVLPWVNYGSGDDGQPEQPEQGNED
ncbi:Unknown protein [Striga hermonthica]|uniref:Transcription factor 25 n=1 Tax=Striga hermonthica TaxID=68872 RepID=A0A9N7RCB3_STRHE|nr:Unknown protein [Striga hermonthica]